MLSRTVILFLYTENPELWISCAQESNKEESPGDAASTLPLAEVNLHLVQAHIECPLYPRHHTVHCEEYTQR